MVEGTATEVNEDMSICQINLDAALCVYHSDVKSEKRVSAYETTIQEIAEGEKKVKRETTGSRQLTLTQMFKNTPHENIIVLSSDSSNNDEDDEMEDDDDEDSGHVSTVVCNSEKPCV